MWEFHTRNFTVKAQIAPEDDSPDFDDEETIEAISRGEIDWFMARVVVLSLYGDELGSDYLGGCAYKDAQEFFSSHRDPDPMNRNSSLMRNARGDNVVICHYFPSMVSEAIKDARRHADRVKTSLSALR